MHIWALKFQKLLRSLSVPWTSVTDSLLSTHDRFNNFWPKKLVPFLAISWNHTCTQTSRQWNCLLANRYGLHVNKFEQVKQVWTDLGDLHVIGIRGEDPYVIGARGSQVNKYDQVWGLGSPYDQWLTNGITSNGHLGIPHEENDIQTRLKTLPFHKQRMADGKNYAFVFLRSLFHLLLGLGSNLYGSYEWQQ